MDFRGDDDCAPHPLSKKPYPVLPMFKVQCTIIISTHHGIVTLLSWEVKEKMPVT